MTTPRGKYGCPYCLNPEASIVQIAVAVVLPLASLGNVAANWGGDMIWDVCDVTGFWCRDCDKEFDAPVLIEPKSEVQEATERLEAWG